MYQPLIGNNPQLQDLDWEQAQPWCNFILMRPVKLPIGIHVIKKQLRTESTGGNRSTYHCIIGNETKKASIKQFLYDWAPPAYDHPNLWRNTEISSIEDTPIPQPHLLDNNVVWIGLNYRRQPAASANILRTSVEITVIEGNFSHEELLEICQNLQPVDTVLMQQILSTSFAELSYAYRHSSFASPVPLSYWHYNRQEDMSVHAYSWNSVPEHIVKEHLCLPESVPYAPNSVFTFGDPQNPTEIEYYYEHIDHPGSYIRLLTTTTKSKYSIPFPPQIGDQSCNSYTVEVKGHTVYYSFLTEQFGPHEAIWQQGENTILLLAKPAPWTNRKWMANLLHAKTWSKF